MKYSELKAEFRQYNDQHWPHSHLTGMIVFTEDSFNKPYTRLSRSYRLSSDNKAYWPHAAGYSIFADCLDGTDQGVRLEWYMAEEGDTPGHRLLELLESNEWVLEAGDTVEVVENWSEED